MELHQMQAKLTDAHLKEGMHKLAEQDRRRKEMKAVDSLEDSPEVLSLKQQEREELQAISICNSQARLACARRWADKIILAKRRQLKLKD